MTRYAGDLDAPVVVRRADRAEHDRRGALGARPPPAPRRRDREVRARHVLLQRRSRGRMAGRDAPARPEPARRRELRPEARDVRRRGGRPCGRRGGRRLRILRRQLRQPRHGRSHRLDPGGRSQRSRRPTVASAGSSTGSTELGGVCLVTADHGNAEQMLEAGRSLPANGPHDEPRPARRNGARSDALPTAARSPISRRRRSICSGSSSPGCDDGEEPRKSFVSRC